METSRLIRRKAGSRQQLIRLISITGKTALICLLLLSWFLDRKLLFTIVAINLAIAMLFINYYNIRRFLPGLNSVTPLKRIAAILFYVLSILGILSYVA